jgi:hypothetical protein
MGPCDRTPPERAGHFAITTPSTESKEQEGMRKFVEEHLQQGTIRES